KLITPNTIEEQIYEMANVKLKLDYHVSQGHEDSTTAKGVSAPNASILNLIRQNWKAVHNQYQQKRQQELQQEQELKHQSSSLKSKSVNGTKISENGLLSASRRKGKEDVKPSLTRTASASSLASSSSS